MEEKIKGPNDDNPDDPGLDCSGLDSEYILVEKTTCIYARLGDRVHYNYKFCA